MIAVVIIGILIILIASSSATKKNRPNKYLLHTRTPNKGKESARTMQISRTNNISADNSIIDVTGNSYQIAQPPARPALVSYPIPYWRHQYVYSFAEINTATPEQAEFYRLFKSSFLKGEFISLEGNLNYAFILLFDLLRNDYEKHWDLPLLEKQFEELGYYYPKTRPYAISFLIEKMASAGDRDGITRIRTNQHHSYYPGTNNNYPPEESYWGLGSRYKSNLNLNDAEVKLLNKLSHPDNNFCNVEYCFLEILKLFLATVKGLNAKLTNEGTSLDQQLSNLASLIVKKQFGYKPGSINYKYAIDPATTELYTSVFKHCENAVREHYGHKRKINTDTLYRNSDISNEIEVNLFALLPAIIQQSVSTINPPDEATEIELYAQNTGRWKIRFEKLIEAGTIEPKKFISDIVALSNLNRKNPSRENIFFEASKFIAKKDKETSLTLYIHYLYHDLKSATFDNKQLTKTIQKSLFKTNDQLHDFEVLVSDLIRDKNLDGALQKVPEIYKAKRKKIRLDIASIKEAKEQHSGTVELLNDYLKDEYEDETNTISSKAINAEEMQIQITPKNEIDQHSIYNAAIAFTPIQQEAMELFAKSNFSLPEADLTAFARSNGIFKNQLVESLNDCCFQSLDDLLIEEEEDFYTINPIYYQRLLAR